MTLRAMLTEWQSRSLDSPTSTHDHGVDPNESPLSIDQGSPRITRIDGGVGLDEILDVHHANLGPPCGADDPHGDRLETNQRGFRANTTSPTSNDHCCRSDRREPLSFDFQYRQIRMFVGPNDLGLQRSRAISQHH